MLVIIIISGEKANVFVYLVTNRLERVKRIWDQARCAIGASSLPFYNIPNQRGGKGRIVVSYCRAVVN